MNIFYFILLHFIYLFYFCKRWELSLLFQMYRPVFFHTQAPVAAAGHHSWCTLLKDTQLSGESIHTLYWPHHINSHSPIHAPHPSRCLGPCDSMHPWPNPSIPFFQVLPSFHHPLLWVYIYIVLSILSTCILSISPYHFNTSWLPHSLFSPSLYQSHHTSNCYQALLLDLAAI